MQNQNKITQAKPVLGSGRSALRGGVIADQQERDIVGLTCAARKFLNRIEYRLLEMIQRRVTAAGKGVPQARDAEQFVVGVGAHGHAGKRALEHRREQGCAESLAGNVRDQEGRAVIAHRKYIEVVAADGEARKINAAHGKMRVIAKAAREKGLLNVACNGEFLFEPLTLAFIFEEAGIIQTA